MSEVVTIAPLSTWSERYQAARGVLDTQGVTVRDPEFAKRVRKSTSSVSAWRKLKSVPPAKTVLTIARACGVDPGWLAFGEASAAPAPAGFQPVEKRPAKPMTEVEGAGAHVVPRAKKRRQRGA